jgi:phytanoyl-CoA hydroxylase
MERANLQSQVKGDHEPVVWKSPTQSPRAVVLEHPSAWDRDPCPSPEQPERFREWFEQEGYVVVRRALPTRLCQVGIEQFRREVLPDRLAFFERHISGKFERHCYTEAGFMKYPIMNLQDLAHRRHAGFRRAGLNLLTHPNVQRAVRILSGEPGRVVHTMYFDGNQTTWAHRDGHYIDSAQAGNMLGVWIAAEDIDPDAGRFFVVPRSHRMRVPGEEGDPNAADYKACMANFVRDGPLDCVAPVLRQGDLLLWKSMTIHGSLPTVNASCSRRSFTAHYVPCSHPYQWNVRTAASSRSVRVNKVEVILHRDHSSLLARTRDELRTEWPRLYGVLQALRPRTAT